MGWLSFCLLGVLLSGCHLKPLDEAVGSSQEMESLLEGLFQRKGREMDVRSQEEQSEVEDLASKTEGSSVTDEDEVKRFNDYMDAVYRRMNAALRAKLMDPMELNLDPKEERKGKNGKKNKRVTREAEDDASSVDEVDNKDIVEMDTEDEAEDPETGVDRIGELENEEKNKKKKKKNGKKNGKKKDEKKDDSEMDEKKNKNKNKKNKNKKNKSSNERKEAKEAKEQKKADKKARKEQKKLERENRRKNKNESEELSRGKRNNHSNDSKRKQKKKDSKEGKARGSLSGIATLRRSGDVVILDEEEHKIVSSEFSVGPLQLEVSKSFGEAKERKMKSAKASTDVMKGMMVVKVKADGSAHVKKVVFKKPEHVDVSGSISEKERKSETQLRNSFNRSRGLAAQKILKTARYVLKSKTDME